MQRVVYSGRFRSLVHYLEGLMRTHRASSIAGTLVVLISAPCLIPRADAQSLCSMLPNDPPKAQETPTAPKGCVAYYLPRTDGGRGLNGPLGHRMWWTIELLPSATDAARHMAIPQRAKPRDAQPAPLGDGGWLTPGNPDWRDPPRPFGFGGGTTVEELMGEVPIVESQAVFSCGNYAIAGRALPSAISTFKAMAPLVAKTACGGQGAASNADVASRPTPRASADLARPPASQGTFQITSGRCMKDATAWLCKVTYVNAPDTASLVYRWQIDNGPTVGGKYETLMVPLSAWPPGPHTIRAWIEELGTGNQTSPYDFIVAVP